MPKHLKTVSVFLISLILVGCSSGPSLNTASGKPEVFIPGVTSREVRAVIIDRGMSFGWSLERETENSISFLRPTNNALASVLLASNYDTRVHERVRYTTASISGGVKLYGSVEFVGNQGSAFEKVTPITNNNYNQAGQRGLEAIKERVIASRPR